MGSENLPVARSKSDEIGQWLERRVGHRLESFWRFDKAAVEQAIGVFLGAAHRNPAILQCTRPSIANTILAAAALRLQAGDVLGLAYCVPYGGQLQLQVGYKGLKELAYRNPQVKAVRAGVVVAGDTFDYDLGGGVDTQPWVRHKKCPEHLESEENVQYAWAVVELEGRIILLDVKTRPEIDARRKRSRARKHSPWDTDFGPMSMKTALRDCLRLAPLTAEIQLAMSLEDHAEGGAPAGAGPLVPGALKADDDAEDEPEPIDLGDATVVDDGPVGDDEVPP